MDTIRLCVNVDHVATLRNARGTVYPDPVHLAVLALNAGADGIVAHLREDRRHVRERDITLLRRISPYFGFEFAMADDCVALALEIKPSLAMLVPERREEVTTESGLDVVTHFDRVAATVTALQEAAIPVSLFVDADEAQVEASARTGARVVELHTGPYADAENEAEAARCLDALHRSAVQAATLGMRVHAGHGLRTDNVGLVTGIEAVEECSIGHFIIARALSVGMEQAVLEMREAMRG